MPTAADYGFQEQERDRQGGSTAGSEDEAALLAKRRAAAQDSGGPAPLIAGQQDAFAQQAALAGKQTAALGEQTAQLRTPPPAAQTPTPAATPAATPATPAVQTPEEDANKQAVAVGGDTVVASPAAQVPPPPPQAPRPGTGAQGQDPLNQRQLRDYAQQMMSAPTRYDIDVVQEGMTSIRAAMDETRRKGMQSTEAALARRGLGASTMGQETSDLARADYDRQEQEQYFNLMREQALTAGADRAAAFGAGRDALGLQQEGQIAREGFAVDRERIASQEAIQSRALDLEEQGMNSDDAWRQAQLEEEKRQFDVGETRAGEEFGFEKEMGRGELAVRERANELVSEGLTQEAAMSKARNEHEQTLQTERIAATASIADKEIAVRNRANELTEKGMDQDMANAQANREHQAALADRAEKHATKMADMGFEHDASLAAARNALTQQGIDIQSDTLKQAIAESDKAEARYQEQFGFTQEQAHWQRGMDLVELMGGIEGMEPDDLEAALRGMGYDDIADNIAKNKTANPDETGTERPTEPGPPDNYDPTRPDYGFGVGGERSTGYGLEY